jgi:uncharacterized membrane protein YdfJ with MMPL/SSD domain
MENAVDALKTAFAVIVFVIALTVSFIVFSQARKASEIVLYLSDKKNFEEYTAETQSIKRTVGIETVISAVKRYINDNENYSVEIKNRNGDTLTMGANSRNKAIFDLLEDHNQSMTPNQTAQRLEEWLKELMDKYNNEKFEESYSQVLFTGEMVETETGEIAEKPNTDTKVKITYIIK